MMSKLLSPIPETGFKKVSQLFGFNSSMYAQFDVPGHQGIDYKVEYGSPVLATHDGYVQSMSVDEPNRRNGNGLYLRSDDNSFYTCYWHLSKFHDVYPGMKVEQGQKIGEVGNTGYVIPTPTPQNPQAGTHLHFAIKIPGLNNEYRGFIDPIPWLFQGGDRLPQKLVLNLGYLSRGDQVSYLQTLLSLELPEPINPIGYFGLKTVGAVRQVQKMYSISATGYVGPTTRNYLNLRYSQYP